MKKILAVLALLIATSSFAEQGEIYMANQAGGYLTLTHERCSDDGVSMLFPWRAYGTESNGLTHEACYVIPPPPTAEEAQDIPAGVTIIPVINLIDLEDRTAHTLRADWFTSEKPNGL